MNDLKTSYDRLSGHRNTTLKIARGLVFAWLPVMLLIITATIFTHYATAHAEYAVIHAFNPVH